MSRKLITVMFWKERVICAVNYSSQHLCQLRSLGLFILINLCPFDLPIFVYLCT
jgi:hypothetical protein